jgi:hypothetical protein
MQPLLNQSLVPLLRTMQRGLDRSCRVAPKAATPVSRQPSVDGRPAGTKNTGDDPGTLAALNTLPLRRARERACASLPASYDPAFARRLFSCRRRINYDSRSQAKYRITYERINMSLGYQRPWLARMVTIRSSSCSAVLFDIALMRVRRPPGGGPITAPSIGRRSFSCRRLWLPRTALPCRRSTRPSRRTSRATT